MGEEGKKRKKNKEEKKKKKLQLTRNKVNQGIQRGKYDRVAFI